VYVALTLAFGGFAIQLLVSPNSPGDREIPAIICGFQVAIGLLLASLASATSLSEERVRGSLDVLLATPLSTAEIVWGKWWGAYRGIPPLAILPGLIACMSCLEDRWVGVPLVLGLVFAYGAVITSLGLALATWIRQAGRVVALCVGIYAALALGWPMVVIMLLPKGPGESGVFAVVGSPFFGIAFGILGVADPHAPDFWPAVLYAALLWIFVFAIVSALLIRGTLRSFNHCLGRIPDRRDVSPAGAQTKPVSVKVPVFAEE
jgi:ABC-type transport system involved in multi-copper enzyme maturation permease subunit